MVECGAEGVEESQCVCRDCAEGQSPDTLMILCQVQRNTQG